MSAYDLYFISGSPPCWRAMLAMAVKGVDYTPKRLDNSKQEQKSPEFLAINPKGTVPVLVGHGVTIVDSIPILNYLDVNFPEPPLFGTTPEETVAVWQEHFSFDAAYSESVRAISRPLFRGKGAEQADEIKPAAEDLRSKLMLLDDKLRQQTHFAGNMLSAADISAYPVLCALERACCREDAQFLELKIAPYEEYFGNIFAWISRMQAIPGHDDAYPPHWRQAAE